MAQPYSAMGAVTQGTTARLISAVKSDAVDFLTICKGVLITTGGTLSFVPNGNENAVSLTVAAGDQITLWGMRRINATGTTCEGLTVEG